MRIYDRNADPLEFGRVVALTDGVFAIALTLLVLDLALPVQTANMPLAKALAETAPRFIAFAISVAVVGTHYLAHHETLSMLQKIDSGLIKLTILYLGFIALIPFVQSVLADRPEESLTLALYATVLGCTSVIAAFMIWHAHRRGLLREPLQGRNAKFEVLRSGLPIFIFFSSAGFAFLIGGWAVIFWISQWPLDAILARLQQKAV